MLKCSPQPPSHCDVHKEAIFTASAALKKLQRTQKTSIQTSHYVYSPNKQENSKFLLIFTIKNSNIKSIAINKSQKIPGKLTKLD